MPPRPRDAGRFDGPIRAAAGDDRGEVAALKGLAIVGDDQLPQRIELVVDLQSFHPRVQAKNKVMLRVDALAAELFGYLGQLICFQHGANSYRMPASSCNRRQFSRRSCRVAIRVADGLPSLSKCLANLPSLRAK